MCSVCFQHVEISEHPMVGVDLDRSTTAYLVLRTQTAEGSSTGWFVGILWILQSESFLEVAMIFQIIPILLVPLQIIFNNVLEEVLSWLFGKQTLPLKSENIGQSWNQVDQKGNMPTTIAWVEDLHPRSCPACS